jgi:DNA-directed RNA polymerase subunit RPC12/RpoP
MFNATEDLLILGSGAARDGDREQARFYLEWLLRDDPTGPQVAEAWYWLSRITDDQAERRRCLAMAIGASPNHPEARRDLALLDGRLRPDELADHRRPLDPHAPQRQVGEDEVRRYRCPSCGGALSFDAARQTLRCQFCGHTGVPGAGDGTVDEQDWAVAAFSRRGHRWVLPTERLLACQSCGATELLPAGQSTGVCAFCGSTRVILAQEQKELLAPEAIAPFTFDVERARQRARQWLDDQPLRPRDLPERAALDTPRPVYLPFWTFDLEGEISWRGYVESNNGRKLRTGTDHLFHDDLHVPAGRSLPAELLRDFRCDAAALVPYAADLLAGWPVELYSLPPTDASLQARERVMQQYRTNFTTDDAGDTIEDLTVSSVGLSVISFKLVLLPAWIVGYRYGDATYRLVLNGHNGAGHGEVPRGRIQGWLARALAWA